MDVIGFIVFLGMLPVIFFVVCIPFFKLGLWLSVDYKSNVYTFTAYLILAFWGIMSGVGACIAWGFYWAGVK